MTMWISVGIVGGSLVWFALAVARIARSLRQLHDILRTIEVRLRTVADLRPAVETVRARVEALQDPFARAQIGASMLQTHVTHQSAS